VSSEYQRAAQASLVGEWSADMGRSKLDLKIYDNGRFSMGDVEGKYSTEGNTLILDSRDSQVKYQFELTTDQLTLSGADLAEPLKFTLVPDTGRFLTRLFDFSPKSIKRKLYRILTVVTVVLACRLIILLLKKASHLLIYSEWGSLKFLYRHHKNRAMTIHSLVLNALKYVIYFSALGFTLREFGVNYTAYLASLSVIGLAIGFGSQGLVQDMVTGFFIIFEGQFDVGDMVEIPPYKGIVKELGLRMTKIRNYLGQEVVIPNRNIAAVGRYSKGAQEVYVDAAARSREAAQEASPILESIGKDIAQQFEGVILTPPAALGAVSLATGKHFARLHVSIWPQQEWIIDQQLVPRIHEGLKAAGLEVPDDKIAVSYHLREEKPVPGWHRRSPTKQ